MKDYIIDGNITRKALQRMLLYEQKKAEQIKKEMKTMPDGNIVIRKNGDRFLIYRLEQGVEHGIKKNKRLSTLLARKYFLKCKLIVQESNCKALQAALSVIDECKSAGFLNSATYNRLSEAFPNMEYVFSNSQLKWLNEAYDKNLFRTEQLKYKTKSGILVRSKSEKIIADILTGSGLMFHYEEIFIANGEIYYPDFTILLDDGRKILWEHFGLTGRQDYLFKTHAKIDNYRKEGYVQHKNLICTYEEDIISEENIIDIVERFLTPLR